MSITGPSAAVGDAIDGGRQPARRTSQPQHAPATWLARAVSIVHGLGAHSAVAHFFMRFEFESGLPAVDARWQ